MDDNSLKMLKGRKNMKAKSLWPIFHKGKYFAIYICLWLVLAKK